MECYPISPLSCVYDLVVSTENVQNVAGILPANAGTDLDHNGQVGNLGLSDQDEDDLVAFISTLSDGFTDPGG